MKPVHWLDRLAIPAAAIVCLWVIGPALGLDVDIDIDALISDDRVITEQVSDELWQIAAPPGKQLVQIPIVLGEVEEDTEIKANVIGLEGGRFVAWYIPEPDAAGPAKAGRRPAFRGGGYGPGAMGPGGFPGGAFPGAGPGQMGTVSRTSRTPGKPNPVRLARALTLHTDGTMSWQLLRALPHGELSSGTTDYHLLLDSSRIKKPQRPKRKDRDRGRDRGPIEQTPEQREAFRQRMDEYRQAVQEYQELRRELRALPTEFSQPAPGRLWAVFMISSSPRNFALRGEEPLPWEMPFDLFVRLRDVVSKAANPVALGQTLRPLVADGHPLSQQTAAIVLTSSTNVKAMATGGEIVDQVKALLKQAPPSTRLMLVEAMASEAANSPALSRLLVEAAADNDPEVALRATLGMIGALRGGQAADRQHLNRAAMSIQRLLADVNGPPVYEVLGPALDVVGQSPVTAQVLGEQIDLSRTSPQKRRNEMIDFVLQAAAMRRPPADRWLSDQLLADKDMDLVAATLRRIVALSQPPDPTDPAAAAAAGQPARPVGATRRQIQVMPGMPFGGPYMGPGAMPGRTSRRGRSAQPATALQFQMEQVPSGLIKAMTGEDENLRQLAWSALPAMRFQPMASRGRPRPKAGQEDEMEPQVPALTIAAAATSFQPTPIQAVDYVLADRSGEDQQQALAHLAAKGSGPAQVIAIRELASGRAVLAVAMNQMAPDERHKIGIAWYTVPLPPDPNQSDPNQPDLPEPELYDKAPKVVGLLRQPGPNRRTASEIVNWFADQVRDDVRPAPYEWAEPMGGPSALLQFAHFTDRNFALAASAALVADIGLDEQHADRLYEQIAAVEGPAPGKDQAFIQELKNTWSEFCGEIFTQQLAESAGSYRITFRITDPAEQRDRRGRIPPGGMFTPGGVGGMPGGVPGGYGMGGPGQGQAQEQVLKDWAAQPATADPSSGATELGTIKLVVDDGKVSVEGAQLTVKTIQEQLALQITKPAELSALAKALDQPMAISFISTPINLTRGQDGSWVGVGKLTDGHDAVITLQRQDDDVTTEKAPAPEPEKAPAPEPAEVSATEATDEP